PWCALRPRREPNAFARSSAGETLARPARERERTRANDHAPEIARHSARVVADRGDERMRPALVVRRARHRELAGRQARASSALEAEAIDLEREAVRAERAPAIVDPEVQVRPLRVPAIAK